MKKILLVITILMFALSFGSISMAYAEENKYVFEDESASVEFVLVDETNFNATATHKVTGDVISLTGTYLYVDNKITFYVGGESLGEYYITENNVLTWIDETTEDTGLKEIESTTKKITEYIIAGVIGLLGTSGVAILFRGSLKALAGSVKTLISKAKEEKDIAKEDIEKVKKEAENTLASLKNVKDEVVNVNKKEFEALHEEIRLLKKALRYFASGAKDFVKNGTAENIGKLFAEPKGVEDDQKV